MFVSEFEVVVVDNGLIDGIFELLSVESEDYLYVFNVIKNLDCEWGFVLVRNLGVREVKG